MGAAPSTTSALPSVTPRSTSSSAAPTATAAPHYLFSFGDSYTATGFDVTSTWPSQGNPLGNPAWPGYTSCNGPNWLDNLITSAPKNTLSMNFAVGGATVDGTICGFPGATNPFTVQASRFTESAAAAHPASARWTATNSVFLVWFGVNDVDLTVGNIATIPPVVDRIMTTYFQVANQLVAVGAQKFVFMGIPPLWRLPTHQNDTADLLASVTTEAQSWNSGLKLRTAQFNRDQPRAKAAFFDVQPFFNTVLDNPTAYGAPNANCSNPDGVSCLWVDGIHPGRAIHRTVAAGVKAGLDTIGFFGKATKVATFNEKANVVQPSPLVPAVAAHYDSLYQQELCYSEACLAGH